MAKGRRRKQIKEKAFNIGNKIFPIVKQIAAPIAFIEQITAKDRDVNAAAFAGLGTTDKLKWLANMVTGRLTGIGFFSGFPTPPQTINPAGVINKWTQAGAIMIGYRILGKAINQATGIDAAPAHAKIGSIGKSFLVGGGLGGFFDDPAPKTTITIPQIQQQIQQAPRMLVGGGSDSTESGL